MKKETGSDPQPYRERLRSREASGLLRSLTPVRPGRNKLHLTVDGIDLVNLCSNDYLNLSSHPAVKKRAVEMIERYGTGAASSRLVSGSLPCHHELEDALASYTNREASLLFVSGFQANVTLLPSLAGRGDWIIADKWVHRSLVEGGQLSRATFRRFRHNDMDHLESMLKRYQSRSNGICWVVVESVYSMDGDEAPLDEVVRISKRYGARVMVDDAHAFGLYGEMGEGLAAACPEIDLIVGTCGKTLGSSGAFALLSDDLRQWLINYCPGVIYSTGPSPAVTGATMAALELLPEMNEQRREVFHQAREIRQRLSKVGLDTGASTSQIVPILLPDSGKALEWSQAAVDSGFYVQAIRPPTVREPRLRLTVCHGIPEKTWCRFTTLMGTLHGD
ncbi:MAG: aminotransferase class I/II-fold pyridoxal phosphate-dependent enzyme [Bacteroidota bacterium]